ncbi:16659_t:CDS:1, partial [Acaulospora colombiana]
GIVYRLTRSYTKALLDLDRAVQNMKDKAFNIDYETKALCNRGVVNRTLGKNQEAARDFNKALLRDPNNIFALCERSKVYEAMGRREKMKADIEFIIKIDPTNEYALERIKKFEGQA